MKPALPSLADGLPPRGAQFIANGLYYKLTRAAGRRWGLFYWQAPAWRLSTKNWQIADIDLEHFFSERYRASILQLVARRISSGNQYDTHDYRIITEATP